MRIFRVDNPHTKAFRVLGMVYRAKSSPTFPTCCFYQKRLPGPKVMYRLAKLGFSQSYTYFPWRNNEA